MCGTEAYHSNGAIRKDIKNNSAQDCNYLLVITKSIAVLSISAWSATLEKQSEVKYDLIPNDKGMITMANGEAENIIQPTTSNLCKYQWR